MMATTKATTTSDLSGAELKTDADQATADASIDDRKATSATLKSGVKVTGPSDVINKIKNRR